MSEKLFGDQLKTAKRELFRTAARELPKSPWDYLRPGPWDPYWDIPSTDPEITGLVQEITRGLTSDKEKAAAIYKWVVQNIEYDCSYSIYEALPTLHARKGVCNGFSLLLAAMMRAGGIPAKFVTGLDAGCRNIQDLARLEFAINLVSLNLAGNWIESIREIVNLQNLKYLNLADNNIRDISPLVKNNEQGPFRMGRGGGFAG